MSTRIPRPRTAALATRAAAAFALSLALGGPAPAQTPAADRSADAAAIRAADDAFVAAYNRGDAKALAAMFTEDAESIEADGARYEGRDLVEKALTETFAADPGVKLALEVTSLRFLSADVAKEEGRTVATPAKGSPVARFFTVMYVKSGGKWLIASVREEEDPLVRSGDRLKDLEWLVGEWLDESAEAHVRVSARWSADRNFLLRDFTVKREGKPVMTVSQRVGWDASARRFRSWEFDSEGGFAEGAWARDGDRWVIKHTGVRPEGDSASATTVVEPEKADLMRWTMTDRVIGGVAVPGVETYVLVRVPPAPAIGAAKPAAPATPSNGRAPR